MIEVKYSCLYCGKKTRRGDKGEHIIPAAIGGALTLNDASDRVVCQRCNSGILSQLDRELCSRSYLSIIASREIGAHLWQAWDVDHSANNLLLDAKPAWAADGWLTGLICYPQMIFERDGLAVRGDHEEFRRFGYEEAAKVLFQAAHQCYKRYCANKKGAIHFERVRSGLIEGRYRLPPRIFTPHPIEEVAKNVRREPFVLRFVSQKDRDFALYSMSHLSGARPGTKWAYQRGSHEPPICFFFDIGLTIRALMKLGLNLIAAYCRDAPVSCESFANAIRISRGEVQVPKPEISRNGFACAADVQELKAADNAHSFRLTHADGMWHVVGSFFGGKLGSYARVPGPNHERWHWVEIVAPLRSKAWSVATGSVLRPIKLNVEWKNSAAVIPSIAFQKTVSSLSVEAVKKKPLPDKI
jgi:DNA-directed RNA polymerase subunit RPC12/RpoP